MTLREKWIEKCVNKGEKIDPERHKIVGEALIKQGRDLIKNYDWSSVIDDDILEFEFSPRTRDFSHDTALITTRLWKEIYDSLLKRMESQGFNKRGFVEALILSLLKEHGIIADYKLKDSSTKSFAVKLFVDGPLPPKTPGPKNPVIDSTDELIGDKCLMPKQEQKLEAISRATCESLWTSVGKLKRFGSEIHDVIKNPKDLPDSSYKEVVAIIYNDGTESFETLSAYYDIGVDCWYILKKRYYRSGKVLLDKKDVYGWYEYPIIPLTREDDGMVTANFNYNPRK
jgi:hypothetical protein